VKIRERCRFCGGKRWTLPKWSSSLLAALSKLSQGLLSNIMKTTPGEHLTD